jgi:hypothetical protein
MTKTGKYVLIGVGILALLGVSVFAMASTRRRNERGELPPSTLPMQQTMQPQAPASVVDVADKVIGSIKGNTEAAQQRLSNRKLRTATRQAKLLKKGKIRIEDLQALQNIK